MKLKSTILLRNQVLIALALVCGTYLNGFAQIEKSKILQKTKTTDLFNLADKWSDDFKSKKEEARQIALARGIPLNIESEGSYAELMYFDKDGLPRYNQTTNVDAAISIGTNELHTGGSTGFNLNGNGMDVGEWDGGGLLLSHEQYNGRATQVDGAAIPNYHAVHVAGILVGDGIGIGSQAAEAKGMAPQATLSAHDWNFAEAEMATFAANGGLVSNHSYGAVAGWGAELVNGVAYQAWLGGTNNLEDPIFGKYTYSANRWDVIANNAPYYLICKTSGNDAGQGSNLVNGMQFYDSQSGTFKFYNSAIHPAPDGPDDCITDRGNAKNILTIGATHDVLNYNSPADVTIVNFSSGGLTDDGRIKPDICANGFELMSASETGNSNYISRSGTSMAAPSVAGSLILLQEHYQKLNGVGNFMLASTLKALVIHTAKEAGPAPGPDYRFGWGLMDSKAAAEQITKNVSQPNSIIENTLTNGETYNISVKVEPNKPVIVTLVWNDPAAPESPFTIIDDPTLKLINDLDMRVSDGTTTFSPYIMNIANPTAPATTGDNFRDNVEKIYMSNIAGEDITITINHKGNLTGGNQDFSLIISDVTGDSCPDNLNLGVVTVDGEYEAKYTITSTANINSQNFGEIIFNAGNNIDLKPGFWANASLGYTLRSQLDGCSN